MQNVAGSNDTVIPQKVLETAKGKDVDLVFDMSDYQWMINGKDITSDSLKDINLEVTFGGGSVPLDAINSVAGGQDYFQVSLSHDGDFGFKAILRIPLDKKYAGKYGNLYYYNNGRLEFIRAGLVNADGIVSFEFTHASDYVVVVGENPTFAYTSPKTGDNLPIIPFAILLVSVASAAASIVIAKRRKA